MKLLSYRPIAMYYNEIDYVTSNCYVATCIDDNHCKFQRVSHHPLYPCFLYPCECNFVATMYNIAFYM